MIRDQFYFLTLYCLIQRCFTFVFIYKTNDQIKTDFYDCISYTNKIYHLQSTKYCIRLDESINLQRTMDNNSVCFNHGIKYSFHLLNILGIEPREILYWNSGIESVDSYAAYLNSLNHYTSSNYDKDMFLCNCIKIGTFGKFCEYNFMSYSTFEETFQYQYNIKRLHRFGSQYVGNRTCYKTLECNYGLLCLDWRNICDGKQQCMDGLDEDYCELLEYNECQINEYRCANGQCIDEEFFLDGDIDCMDRTDEQYKALSKYHIRFNDCPFKPDFNCEELLAPRTYFSCGDGELYPDTAVLYSESYHNEHCLTFRDKNFMCELDQSGLMMWTKKNGQCVLYGRLEGNTTDDICLFLIKCALTNGQGRGCPCNGQNCKNRIIYYNCTTNGSYVEYPKGGIFAPFVKTFYLLDYLYGNRRPNNISFSGSIKWNGFQVSVKELNFIDYDAFTFASSATWRHFEYLYCNIISTGRFAIRNLSGPQYDENCWKSLYKSVKCPYTDRCISVYRIADGNSDCESDDDEPSNNVNPSLLPVNCSSIQKHRFQCSKEEPSCLLSTNIGDTFPQCLTNNRDEYFIEKNLKLSNHLCTIDNPLACQLIKQYIEQSSSLFLSIINTTNYDTNNNLTLSEINSMSFNQYCDTIWDLKLGFDETPFLCKDWICPSNYYQCHNGQCIPSAWICDGEWDCSDASDEEVFLTITKLSLHNSKVIDSIKLLILQEKCRGIHIIRPFSNLCTQFEYPCLLTNVKNPFNFTENPPCINITKIGDGISDCYGGLDERNIRGCSSQRMLGFNFDCPIEQSVTTIDNHCIPYREQCINRCLNGEDKILCFYLKNNSKIRCNGDTVPLTDPYPDVNCLNGTCILNARCNGILECSYGEDEYYCANISTAFRGYRPDKHHYMTEIVQNVHLSNYPEKINEILLEKSKKDLNLSSSSFQIPKRKLSLRIEKKNLINDYRYFDPTNIDDELSGMEEYLINTTIEAWTCNRGVTHDFSFAP
ncbi:unnamed protein product, partial [Adineta ricciae]